MKIIIEGPDGSGKSYLAEYLKEALGIPINEGLGPEKYPGEINTRVRDFLDNEPKPWHHLIYDRHPCVSHNIYAPHAQPLKVPVKGALLKEFYSRDYLFIYCRGHPDFEQVENHHDTPEHLALMARGRDQILEAYDQWGLGHAHLIHRRGTKSDEFILNHIEMETIVHG